MKKRVCLVVSFLLLTAVGAAAQSLTGNWTLTFTEYKQETFSLVLKQDGSALSGTLTLPMGTRNVSGRVEGDRIRFHDDTGSGVEYNGEFTSNFMTGFGPCPYATDKSEWTARRKK